MKNASNLVWLDLEMTGLDPEIERIIEAAIVVTDKDLVILAQSPIYVIHQDDSILDRMDVWNTQTHTRTGLVDRVRASNLTEREAEQAMLEFIKAWVPATQTPLCGNTIHQDRRFLQKYMPELESYFHYRNIDVSTIKELVRRWKPEILKGIVKKGAHQALEDIIESIEEMKYYRKYFFDLSKS
ncbi:MAG: oligoribonuclease [Neisseriaceae bacterium]|nr:MAG: oligoribonuclease [Neisseriaceae bacterium]